MLPRDIFRRLQRRCYTLLPRQDMRFIFPSDARSSPPAMLFYASPPFRFTPASFSPVLRAHACDARYSAMMRRRAAAQSACQRCCAMPPSSAPQAAGMCSAMPAEVAPAAPVSAVMPALQKPRAPRRNEDTRARFKGQRCSRRQKHSGEVAAPSGRQRGECSRTRCRHQVQQRCC